MKGPIDLHVHTTASDGTLTPYQLVKHASEKGLSAVAITDHDTIAGIKEAISAGQEFGVEIIPGLEISVDHESEMHILGYFLKPSVELENRLKDLRVRRNKRNVKIINKLNEFGFDISIDEIQNKARHESVGRPHIASVLLSKGYVKSISEAFDVYLAEGRKAYFERERISPKEGIDLIKNAGGISVLAHPKYLRQDGVEDVIASLKEVGLQGIEVYYSMNKKEEIIRYKRIAKRLCLIATGGSDFHGTNKENIEIGCGLGDLRIKYEIIENMRKILT
ncbi:MAG: PHP domain-containing protein [Ignavibacteriales bacterium]